MKNKILIQLILFITITLWNHASRAQDACECVDIHTFPSSQEDQINFVAKCYNKTGAYTTIYNTTYSTKEANRITDSLKKYKRCVMDPSTGKLLLPKE